MTSPVFFIFGFGYTAKFLAHELVTHGFKVIGTVRDKNKALVEVNSQPEIIAFDDECLSHYLSQATHILVTIPPDASLGDPVLAQYRELICNYPQIKWLGYLSSTGVYGDHQGAWVNENSRCLAVDGTGALRLAAEHDWMTFAKETGLPLHIFRLAGIYGPYRNALVRLLAGKKASIYKKGQFFSRIHVADICAVIWASMQKPHPYSLYNVADDEPAAAHLVDAYAATLLHYPSLPLIPLAQARLSPMEQHFYRSNRCVDNTKIKEELNVKLRYPTYREGLKACLQMSPAVNNPH